MTSSKAAALVAGGLALCAFASGYAAPAAGAGVSAAPSTLQPSGQWVDETGRLTSLASLAGAPFILSAVFTSCTLRCPLTLEKLRAVDDAFRRRGAPVSVRLLTLDPRTDTPERLRRFKEEHHLPESWHFLRGSVDDTRALARSLGVHVAYDDAHIDHDVQIAVFDGNGRLTRRFSSWSFDVDDAVVTQ
jgi:protein SCO1/2